jgi:VanZ family protein
MVEILPILVTLVVVAVIVFRFIQRVNSGYRVKLLLLGLGVIGVFFSLAIPDPHVPIKRVHVAEYIILSFIVRYTLSHRLHGAGLLTFTILVTMLFGIHDEMLQGLHTLRYYGWRDIIVNGTAGLSGALLGHGLISFEKEGAGKTSCSKKEIFSAGIIAAYLFLMTAVASQVILLYQNRGGDFPYPAFLPLSASCLTIVFFYPRIVFDSHVHHGFQTVFWLSLALIVYPLAANIVGIDFI